MSQTSQLKTFSVSRNDLLYDYAKDFGEIFKFSPFKTDTLQLGSGVKFTESLGYDFQNECSPVVEIFPINEEKFNTINIDGGINDFMAVISIEDIGLSIRKTIFEVSINDIQEKIRKVINLNEHTDLSFYRGFEIKCFISRKSNVDNNGKNRIIWNKSQIVHQENFIVKASTEEAFFQITWRDLGDDILYFVEWFSQNVSSDVDTECFQVVANSNLKDQFKRLENNKLFGEFCIRIVAVQILQELLNQCLRFAELTEEPQQDSLHDKFITLLKNNDFDFTEMAKSFQSKEPFDQMSASSEVTKFIQQIYNIGSVLSVIKFGGYR